MGSLFQSGPCFNCVVSSGRRRWDHASVSIKFLWGHLGAPDLSKDKKYVIYAEDGRNLADGLFHSNSLYISNI
jgi:hypothetical protein